MSIQLANAITPDLLRELRAYKRSVDRRLERDETFFAVLSIADHASGLEVFDIDVVFAFIKREKKFGPLCLTEQLLDELENETEDPHVEEKLDRLMLAGLLVPQTTRTTVQ